MNTDIHDINQSIIDANKIFDNLRLTILGTPKGGSGTIPPYNPQQTIPLPKDYKGGTVIHFFAAFLTLVFVVYLLPSKYALWVPLIVLMGYGANRTSIVTNILKSINKSVSQFYTVP